MPDEFGVCHCGGTGEDGCTPAESAQPSLQDRLTAQLIEAVRSVPRSVLEQAVRAAAATPHRLPAPGETSQRAALPAPSPMRAVFEALSTERETLSTRRNHDG
jgi:hypothetical protein